MKYLVAMALALLSLVPDTAFALEAKLGWFTNAAIVNSSKMSNDSTFTSVPGTLGNGIDLADKSADVTVSSPSLQQVHGAISFWLKPNGWNGTDTATRTFLKIGTTGTTTSNGLLIEKKGKFLRFVMTGGPSGSAKTTVARGDVSNWVAGEWRHVAVAWKDNADGSGKPLGLWLWIDHRCDAGPVWGDAQAGAAFCVPGTTVTIGGGSSYPADAYMDELIFRTQTDGNSAKTAGDNGRSDMKSSVYRDYFQTAPYTAIEIDNKPNQVASDNRVVAGYTKQFGLRGNFAGTGRMDRMTDFALGQFEGYNWGYWGDAKPFITWSSSNTNVATVDTNGLMTAKPGAPGQSCTLTARYGPSGYGKQATYTINVISPNQPDLDLMYVERMPRYNPAVQQWPIDDTTVTFTAHISNWGYQPSVATTVRFEVIPDNSPRDNLPNEAVDGTQTQTLPLPALAAGASTTVSFNWGWLNNPTFIRITVNPGGENSEICNANNMRCDLNIARAFRWSGVTPDIATQYNSATRVITGTGSFSYYDWCQAQIERWNLMIRESVFQPMTGAYGALDQARVDNFMLDWATNPDWNNSSIGAQYNGQYEFLGDISPTYTSYINPGVCHEIGHTTFSLYDEYGMGNVIKHVYLKDQNNGWVPYAYTPVLPDVVGGMAIYPTPWGPPADHATSNLMHSVEMIVTPWQVGWIHYWGTHNLSGATSLPERQGHFWGVQGSRIPNTNTLTFTDRDEAPLTGAAVYIYQVNNPGEYAGGSIFNGMGGGTKYYYDRPKFVGNTNSSGQFAIPSVTDVDWDDPVTDAGPAGSPSDGGFAITNPFQTRARSEAATPQYAGSQGLFLIKVVKTTWSGTLTEFYPMALSEFNEAWMNNGYNSATPGNYPIRTSLLDGPGTTAVIKPTVPEAVRTTNLKPVAVAPTVYAVPNGPFTIDASGSYDPEGQPLTYFWSKVSGDAFPYYNDQQSGTGATLSGMAPGTYTDSTYSLYVFDGVRVSNSVNVTVKVRGGAVSGAVKFGGVGVAGAIVGFKSSPKATADAEFYVTTDASGNYTMQELMPGTYYVAAWKDGYCPSSDQVITVSASPVTANITLAVNNGENIIYNRSDLVSDSDPSQGTPRFANDVDTTLGSCWYVSPSTTDPVYFYVSLGGTDNIRDVVFYREEGWVGIDYWIDAMTAGNPLIPGDWNIPGNSYNAYSALNTIGGYTIPTPASRCVTAINLPLNGIKGLRFKFTSAGDTMYNLYDVQIHSATQFIGRAMGVVKDSTTGAPIYNAAVQIGGFGGKCLITDTTGSYSLVVDPGSYELYGDAPGYGAKFLNVTVPGDGTSLVQDIVLTPKAESLYNGNFETAIGGDATKADGWEIYVWNDAPTSNYVGTRSTERNSTPGGSASGWIHTGTPLNPQWQDQYGNWVYWLDGWLRPTAAHRVPVDPSSRYNFYFKVMDGDTVFPGYDTNMLIWLRADLTEISRLTVPASPAPLKGVWTQKYNAQFPEFGSATYPTLQVTPPAGAAYAEVRLGMRLGFFMFQTRVDELFFDDLVVDEIPSPSNEIGDLKALEDGSSVSLTGKIVTAAPGVGGVPMNVFYIEETDRSSGIRVASSQAVIVGNSVSLTGTMATTASGERYINAATVLPTAGTALTPLGANTKALAETLMDGLLVRAAGKVNTLGTDYYTISDGYTNAGVEILTKAMTGGAPDVSVDDFVIVTGAASLDAMGRVILVVP